MRPTFPTGLPHRGIAPRPGNPDRAGHCVCVGGPRVFSGHDRCDRCGKYPKDTVSETWQRRAGEVAAQRARRAKRGAA